MAAKNTSEPTKPSLSTPTSSSSSSSNQDSKEENNPQILEFDKANKPEYSETSREAKRRKNCPKALEKVEELASSNPSFSFTFDTKFSGCVPEITPKFGSFNLVLSNPDMNPSFEIDQKGEDQSEINEGCCLKVVEDG